MIGALCYWQACSFWNRLTTRLKRLRQPKYLVGAIVGGAYFYFYFFRFMFAAPPGRQGGPPVSLAADPALAAGIGTLALFVVVLVAWLFPRERAALNFSEAEIAFLFPAPISRRSLIHYKILRSQTAILFTTILLTLFTGRWRAGGGEFWISLLGYWVILATLNLHFLGASFVRTWLQDAGVTVWRRRAAVLGLLALAIGAGIFWGGAAMRWPQAEDFSSLAAFVDYERTLLDSGPLPWLLYPFRLVIGPFLAQSAGAFVVALGPALAIMAAHYLWVIRANVSFEEASVAKAQKLAARIAAVRAGGGTASVPKKAARDPFRLRPAGPPSVAFLWKNLIAAGQHFTARMWLILLLSMFFPAVMIALTARQSPGLMFIGAAALGLLCMSFLMGPQLLRQDLRQDLPAADVIKVYPLRGWQVVLGEILAPVVILTAIQWLLIVLVVVFFALPENVFPLPRRLACGLGAVILAPALDFITMLIPNTAALVFPGWIPMGKEAGQRGLEVMGQALIMMFGQVLVFTLALVPAAAVVAAVVFAGHLLGSWAAAVPVGALVAAAVLVGEGGAGILLLGKRFERLDVSAELSG
jgi:hypothetical protein